MTAFSNIVGKRHEYARDWKQRKGGKVFGFFGDYVPEEIIYAAGILPVKIFGSRRETGLANANISPEKWCFFCRDCFAEALSGKYDYLDGIVISLSCFHLQQSFDSWILHLPISFHHYLDMPFYVQGKFAVEAFVKEVIRFKDTLEKFVGKPIPDDSLEETIKIYNKNRRLMREIYDTRKSDYPLVSGTQAMEMVLASSLMEKEEHNSLLEKLLVEIPKSIPQNMDNAPRLMILGA